jgi:predicted lipase
MKSELRVFAKPMITLLHNGGVTPMLNYSSRLKDTVHGHRTAILLYQYQMSLIQAICIAESSMCKSLPKKKQSGKDSPDLPKRISETHDKCAIFGAFVSD